MAIEDHTIEELELTVRTYNILKEWQSRKWQPKKIDIGSAPRTVLDLTRKTRKQLFVVGGRKFVKEIEDIVVGGLGLKLADDPAA